MVFSKSLRQEWSMAIFSCWENHPHRIWNINVEMVDISCFYVLSPNHIQHLLKVSKPRPLCSLYLECHAMLGESCVTSPNRGEKKNGCEEDYSNPGCLFPSLTRLKWETTWVSGSANLHRMHTFNSKMTVIIIINFFALSQIRPSCFVQVKYSFEMRAQQWSNEGSFEEKQKTTILE